MTWHYPKKGGKKPAGGIRFDASRPPAHTAWSRRWLQTLSSFGWKARLEKGRPYATAGHVLSLQVDKGFATADVHGSRLRPYQVEIGFAPFSAEAWRRAAQALEKRAFHTARLLGGDMPIEVERLFRAAGAPLFPASTSGITFDCSCPGGEMICKHVAAVFFLLGQEFDRNPFLIFEMRGISRERLLAEVQILRRSPDGEKGGGPEAKRGPTVTDLSGRLNDFFDSPDGAALARPPEPGFLDTLPAPGTRIREMGVPPFWQSDNEFDEVLVRIYQRVRQRQVGMR